MAINKPLAWVLATVSSGPQEETLVHQEDWAKREAAKNGWRIGRTFKDVASGKDGLRRPVVEMMAELRGMAAELRPQWLMTIRLDRLSRGKIEHSQVALHNLREMGVKVWTRDHGEIKLETAMDDIIVAVHSTVARFENEVRMEKSREVYRRKRAAGEWIGNRLPYGLYRDKDGNIVAYADCAKAIKEAFRLRLEGKGYMAIGKILATFAPPHRFKNSTKANAQMVKWFPNRVKQLLERRIYVGPIIDEATFARAQRVTDSLRTADRSNDSRRRYPWPLRGSLTCICGRMLVGMICGNTLRRYRYYGCRDTSAHQGHQRLLPANEIEAQFVDLLSQLRASPDLIQRWRRRSAVHVSATSLEKKLKDLNAELSSIAKSRDSVWQLHESGHVRGDDVQERLDALAIKRDGCQNALEAVREQLAIAKSSAERKRDVEDLFRRAVGIFKRADVAQQNAIAKAARLELGGLYVDQAKKLKVGKP